MAWMSEMEDDVEGGCNGNDDLNKLAWFEWLYSHMMEDIKLDSLHWSGMENVLRELQ